MPLFQKEFTFFLEVDMRKHAQKRFELFFVSPMLDGLDIKSWMDHVDLALDGRVFSYFTGVTACSKNTMTFIVGPTVARWLWAKPMVITSSGHEFVPKMRILVFMGIKTSGKCAKITLW